MDFAVDIDFWTLKTTYGWLVGGGTWPPDNITFTDGGNGPEPDPHLDDVYGPFKTEAAAEKWYRAALMED